ncbi:hypothetical protein BB560_000518 [Smittium megazygosporum]|uniref:Tryptophan synthase beta chain-like PALP domain-containing protein n=1 Tax=Smittium megazygosporum TaxID=133381 RepID=A0A2T9ZK46_9FUNG|nr:hypothetical protein BB560_000518 [Smittium megazygosporum]
MNPGGSAKDRIALEIVCDAEKKGLLYPNSNCCIFEGTSGSTGLSLCMVAHAKGYKTYIVMPSDVSEEKKSIVRKMGATLEIVKPCSIVDPGNYARVAQRRAQEYHSTVINKQNKTSKPLSSTVIDKPSSAATEEKILTFNENPGNTAEHTKSLGFFMDQFENLNNFKAHYNHTGPEIFAQTRGKIDAFVHGSGTGGTIAGVTYYLKPRVPNLRVYLADPQGSGLANKVNHNVMYSITEKEGTRRRHQTDTIVEGIGLNRMTANFNLLFDSSKISQLKNESDIDISLSDAEKIKLDGAFTVSDQKTIWMSRWLMKNDGLFIGSSSALNCAAIVPLAKLLGPGCTILTILCDSGQRHLTKFWDDDYLSQKGFDVTCPRSIDAFM